MNPVKTNSSPKLPLIISLMMFPQIVETIYSPVLPHLAVRFSVSAETAAQTLSVYFIAFAVGVIFWGRIADITGRRPAMLAGLLTYGAGAGLALLATNFTTLLIARMLSAFGAAVGSVVTQTILRDSFRGRALANVFTIMGIGISVSPVIGLLSGGLLAGVAGHLGVFSLLLVMAILLWSATVLRLPETRPAIVNQTKMRTLAMRMFTDAAIWRSALLVAMFNLMLFSYYSLAPFVFHQLGYSSLQFGYSGIVMAIGSIFGSLLNRKLLQRLWPVQRLKLLSGVMALLGGFGVLLLQNSILFLLPMLLMVISFAIAIPNLLAHALKDYQLHAGSAGALFGLLYYLLLGGALGMAGMLQDLGLVELTAAIIVLVTMVIPDRLRTQSPDTKKPL